MFVRTIPVAGLSSYSIGLGGRASLSAPVVAVFGASGFLGRYTCNELGQTGHAVNLPNRGCELEFRHLKPMFDLGQAKFSFYSPRDRQSIVDAIRGADVVINCVGKHYETKALTNQKNFPYLKYVTNFGFTETHVTVPRTIAEVAAELDVKQFIHVSSVAASADSPSEWARSKAAGEAAVKAAFGEDGVTVIRPNQMFGPEDRLLNWFAIAARAFPFVPLPNDGESLSRPVYMGDVAKAITKCVGNQSTFGKTLILEGKDDFTYKELSEFVYDITTQSPIVLPLPVNIAGLMGRVMGMQPNPAMTEDQAVLWGEDYLHEYGEEEEEVVEGFAELGLVPTPIEEKAFAYLHRYKAGGHFAMVDTYVGHVNTGGDKK